MGATVANEKQGEKAGIVSALYRQHFFAEEQSQVPFTPDSY
jgi:hypothetical protein